MYTFIILVIVSFLISGIIFGKRLKENQFFVALIVICGTLLGSVIVNGVVGLKAPFKEVKVKEYPLNEELSKIITPTDTIKFISYLEYTYRMKADSSIRENHLDFKSFDVLLSSEANRISRFSINWLPEGDTIPRYERWVEKRIIGDNRWISSIGIPNGRRLNKVFIPHDSIHMVLVNHLNDKFFRNEERKIAFAN